MELKKYFFPHACLANGGTAEIFGAVDADLELREFACQASLIVVKDLAVDCLLGLYILHTHPKTSRLLKRLENIRNTSVNTSSSEIESEVKWEQVIPSEINQQNTPLTSMSTVHTQECDNYSCPTIPIALARAQELSSLACSRGMTLPAKINT